LVTAWATDAGVHEIAPMYTRRKCDYLGLWT
jgi:hypothetical protein